MIYGRRLVAHLFESGSVSQDSGKRADAYKDPQGLDVTESDPEPENWADSMLSTTDWSDDE